MLLLFHIPLLIAVVKCENYKNSKEIILTDEWQVLGPDQTVPRGAHISIDLTTGEKLVRKLQPTNPDQPSDTSVALVPLGPVEDHQAHEGNSKRVGYNISLIDALSARETAPLVETNQSRLEELKEAFEHLSLLVSSDIRRIRELLLNYSAKMVEVKDVDQIAGTHEFLVQLNDLLEDVDNAQNFADMNGFETVNHILNTSTNDTTVGLAASVIGVAAQNNKPVQRALVKNGTLPILARLMSNVSRSSGDDIPNNVAEKFTPPPDGQDTDSLVPTGPSGYHLPSLPTRKRVLFALSSLIRGFPPAQALYFNELRGLDRLKTFAGHSIRNSNDTYSQMLVTKTVTLVDDLVAESDGFKNYSLPGDQDYEESLAAYKNLDLKLQLEEGNWCYIYAAILPRLSELSAIEGVIRSWRNLMPVCHGEFKSLLPALEMVSAKLQSEDPSDYQADLSSLIDKSKEMVESGNRYVPMK